jgi:hypothetical protein
VIFERDYSSVLYQRSCKSHWIEEGLERDYPELVQKIREGDE